jgi:hypothetical protein
MGICLIRSGLSLGSQIWKESSVTDSICGEAFFHNGDAVGVGMLQQVFTVAGGHLRGRVVV